VISDDNDIFFLSSPKKSDPVGGFSNPFKMTGLLGFGGPVNTLALANRIGIPLNSPEALAENPFTTHITIGPELLVPSPVFETAGTFTSRAFESSADY